MCARLALELRLKEGGRSRDKARQCDGSLGQHGGTGLWVQRWVTCSESGVVGQNEGHDGSYIRVDALSWSHGLHCVKVLQVLNGLQLDRLHALYVLSGWCWGEVVVKLWLGRSHIGQLLWSQLFRARLSWQHREKWSL